VTFRIGHGYDVHKLGGRGPLRLGGAVINETDGLCGHSDGDVLLHAILDAFLGALALGDIGQWFPDTDPAYEGTCSAWFAEQLLQSPQAGGWTISNIDSTIIAERPRLAPHISRIRDSAAAVLGTDREAVSVKATTNEGMGFTGRGEGIAAYSVILLNSIPQQDS